MKTSFDLSRRDFMLGCSAGIVALSGSRVLDMAFDALGKRSGPTDPILVVVFLRGGIDGLNLLAPVDDKDYVAARPPALRVTESGEQVGLPIKNGPADLDFRLHKAAAPLKELYDGGSLAFVHACGLTHGTRSHFEAMDYVERGLGAQTARNVHNGWIARMTEELTGSGPIRALSATDRTPDSMLGMAGAVAMANPESFNIPVGEPVAKYLRRLYVGDTAVHRAGATTLDAIETVHRKLKDEKGAWLPYVPSAGAQYPEGELGNSLKTVARVVRADLGLQVAAVDLGGWDTHEYQTYRYAPMVEHLSRSIAAFYNDLHAYHDRLNVVVMSEFGRRLRANQSQGTDHGHGNLMMALGGGVNGGRVFGKWPGLATEQLDQGADLAITTDYRRVLSELASGRLRSRNADKLFPGYAPEPALGVFKAG